jgi:hypothetical protein
MDRLALPEPVLQHPARFLPVAVACFAKARSEH